MSDETSSPLAADLLRGAAAIAAYIGETEQRLYYQVERGLLPVGRVGSTLVGSKKALTAHFERLTNPPTSLPADITTIPQRQATSPRRGRRRRVM